MKLYVVRHGETIENKNKVLMGHNHGTLTELGIKQAKETAQKLENNSFEHIFSSDLQRCVDTAELLKEYHPNTPLTFTPELRELNMGVFQGQKRDDIDWNSLNGSVMERKPENGESLSELNQRVKKFVGSLLDDHKEYSLLLVTHAGVIRQLLSIFSGVPSEYIYKNIPIENAHSYEIDVYEDMTGKILDVPELSEYIS